MTRTSPEDNCLRTTTLLPLWAPARTIATVPGVKVSLKDLLCLEKKLAELPLAGLKMEIRLWTNGLWVSQAHLEHFVISCLKLASFGCQTALPKQRFIILFATLRAWSCDIIDEEEFLLVHGWDIVSQPLDTDHASSTIFGSLDLLLDENRLGSSGLQLKWRIKSWV